MGRANKLTLAASADSTIIEFVVSRAAAFADDIVVVVGHQADTLRDLPGLSRTRIVFNSDWRHGMSSSIARGAAACLETARGIMIWPADMPLITDGTVRRLVGGLSESESPGIYVPTYGRQRGHPVLFDAAFRRELELLEKDVNPVPRQPVPGEGGGASEGDRGARPLLRAHEDLVIEVPVDDPGILFDVDSRKDYDEFLAAARRTR
jgi:molybdenum cofactor cytidylyltransferase